VIFPQYAQQKQPTLDFANGTLNKCSLLVWRQARELLTSSTDQASRDAICNGGGRSAVNFF